MTTLKHTKCSNLLANFRTSITHHPFRSFRKSRSSRIMYKTPLFHADHHQCPKKQLKGLSWVSSASSAWDLSRQSTSFRAWKIFWLGSEACAAWLNSKCTKVRSYFPRSKIEVRDSESLLCQLRWCLSC